MLAKQCGDGQSPAWHWRETFRSRHRLPLSRYRIGGSTATVEAGGRFFLNNPQRNGSAYLGQQSLAKFYEYRDLRPGPFGNVWLSTGSRDGLYEVDVGGKNIGYDDQDYYLEASKAGQHYFNFDWDQTPHLYSTSAQTFYRAWERAR